MFAGISLFLSLVLHPIVATLNGKGYWETVEDNIFDSVFDFFGTLFSAVIVVSAIIIYCM